ncbi:hypothetical protein PCANC_04242 [Puccinia coronata f. sp. avenae]|uniref:Uncharacterized protein n=1 Tax=Puccinia coronata f. sp. avenae TaxID=200324 RepID=A0A2N5VX61_9BASI|nr:hypothetical protein PCANC_04242 [Puccinia coronata f. sp. avenae]
MDNSTTSSLMGNSSDDPSEKWNVDQQMSNSDNLPPSAVQSGDGNEYNDNTVSGLGWSTPANSPTFSASNSSLGWNSSTTNSTNSYNASALLSNSTTNTTASNPSNLTSQLVSTSMSTTPSASSEPYNPSVMGHVEVNAAMWRQPGIIIGVTCSILGLLCIILGLAYRLHQQRRTRSPIRGLRVASGFDFNGGADDDDYGAYNVWNKPYPEIGSAAADKGEKAAFEYDGPLTVMGSLRHSTATMYSNADDEDARPHPSSPPPPIDEKGIAY